MIKLNWKYILIATIATIVSSCNKKEEIIDSPEVHIITPLNNSKIAVGSTIIIEADPKDNDGLINHVELLVDGVSKQVFDKAPFQYEWKVQHMDVGMHTIKFMAYDDMNATGASEIQIEVVDFRDAYLGNFSFTIITDSWQMWQPTTYDTSYFNGTIRCYDLTDSANDIYYSNDDTAENPDQKITIEFLPNQRITSLIDTNGVLVNKSGYHYHHGGQFLTDDSIAFYVSGLGGLGAGYNYSVKGLRQ